MRLLQQTHLIHVCRTVVFNAALSLWGCSLVTVLAQSEEGSFEKALRNQTKVFHKGVPRPLGP